MLVDCGIRGILGDIGRIAFFDMSPPVQGRGLKHGEPIVFQNHSLSPLIRECRLKHIYTNFI
jgi:hypothetical protein